MIELIFIFIFGTCVGSFLNSFVQELETRDGVRRRRSHCDHCKTKLRLLDLVPVLSFMFLGGRCRYCRERLSWQYPAVEIATGLLFIVTFLLFSGDALDLGTHILLLCILLVVFIYDLKHYLIPDSMIIAGLLITLPYTLLNFSMDHVWAALIPASIFAAIHFLSRGEWMGLGDAKLILLLGWFLGFPEILVGVFVSVFLGAFVGSALVLFKSKGWKSEIPFGPFLIIGGGVALVWGEVLAETYLRVFGMI